MSQTRGVCVAMISDGGGEFRRCARTVKKGGGNLCWRCEKREEAKSLREEKAQAGKDRRSLNFKNARFRELLEQVKAENDEAKVAAQRFATTFTEATHLFNEVQNVNTQLNKLATMKLPSRNARPTTEPVPSNPAPYGSPPSNSGQATFVPPPPVIHLPYSSIVPPATLSSSPPTTTTTTTSTSSKPTPETFPIGKEMPKPAQALIPEMKNSPQFKRQEEIQKARERGEKPSFSPTMLKLIDEVNRDAMKD
jgi:uncharacterized Zn finger protein (UPF0148 family)